MRSLSSFNSKLLKPCRRLLRLARLPYKRLTFRIFRKHTSLRRETKKRSRAYFFSAFRWRSRRSSAVGMDGTGELRSFVSETGEHYHEPFPSPTTPAFVRLMVARRLEEAAEIAAGAKNDEAAEACRSFEKYLVEMIVEEGKVGDLTDVEELLRCWSSLKSPVFVDLVSRFYGELCMDLFSHIQ